MLLTVVRVDWRRSGPLMSGVIGQREDERMGFSLSLVVSIGFHPGRVPEIRNLAPIIKASTGRQWYKSTGTFCIRSEARPADIKYIRTESLLAPFSAAPRSLSKSNSYFFTRHVAKLHYRKCSAQVRRPRFPSASGVSENTCEIQLSHNRGVMLGKSNGHAPHNPCMRTDRATISLTSSRIGYTSAAEIALLFSTIPHV
jgi:hypothetical protein